MPALDPGEMEALLETARQAAAAGGRAALAHWRGELRVETKADRSPVTQADRDAEAAILAAIRHAWPDDAVLAEESGAAEGTSGRRWIVDPLDGTRGFSRGGTFWGPIVAVEREGEVLAGAIVLPALGEGYAAARGAGAWRDGEEVWLTDASRWDAAVVSLGELPALLFGGHGEAVAALIRTASQARCYGDLASCAQLLSGRADAWLEAGVKAWDLAALQVLVEEAGGRFTDFSGRRGFASGQAVAAGPALHAHAVTVLAARPGP